MSTRPNPSRTTAEDAARRIHTRRTRNHGRDEASLPDPRDLLGMVRHVRAWQDPGRHRIPDGILREDLADVTVILDHLEHALDVERLASLLLGKRMMSLADLASALGYEGRGGKQAISQWIKRLRAAAELDGPKDAALVDAEAAAGRTAVAQADLHRAAALEAWHRLVDLGRRGLLPDELLDDMHTLAHLQTLPAAVAQLRQILAVLNGEDCPGAARSFAVEASAQLAA